MSIRSFRFRRVFYFFASLLVICATVSVAGWSLNLSLGQGRGKAIGKTFTRNSVVEFEEIKAAGKTVKFNERFDGNDDWIPTVRFKAKNISNKSIVYLAVNINFPETRATLGAMMSYPIEFGQKPDSTFPSHGEPMVLLPNDTVEINLQDHYPRIKAFIERRLTLKDIHQADLEVNFVIFDDKTGWSAGNYYRQDPVNPDRYINIGDKPNQ
jgi:hypothetical protein